MDELQEVVTVEDVEQIVGEYVVNYSAESPNEDVINQVAEEAAEAATSDVVQQVTDAVEHNRDFLVEEITESVTSAIREERQTDGVVVAAIEQGQYDEMVAAYRNGATLVFAETILVAVVVGCLVFQQFRGRWG